MLDKASINRFKHCTNTTPTDIRNGITPTEVCCPVCGKVLGLEEAKDMEYVKTKRGTEIFVHTVCVPRWGR